MNVLKAFLLAAVPLTLAACEVPYGVSRTARLDTFPPPDCTERVLRETPGIQSITRLDPRTGADLAQEDPVNEGGSYGLKFRGSPDSHIVGAVEFDSRGGYSYFLDRDLHLSRRPPQVEVDATRAVMRQLEVELARQCGATQLLTETLERCYGVECKALSE